MKHLYSLFILFPLFSFAQWQVSVGAKKGMEWGSGYDKIDNLFSAKNLLTPTFNSEYWTDHYSAGVSFLDHRLWYSMSLSYMYSSYHVYSRNHEDGHGKYYSKWSDYNLDLEYAYLGLGFRIEGVLNDGNDKFQCLLGGRLDLDFNVMSSTTNETRTSFKKYVNSDDLIVIGPYDDSENMKGMIEQSGVFASLGPVFTFRLNLKSMFIDIPIGFGLRFTDHRAPVSARFGSEGVGHGFSYFNYGIRLGYTFDKKTE